MCICKNVGTHAHKHAYARARKHTQTQIRGDAKRRSDAATQMERRAAQIGIVLIEKSICMYVWIYYSVLFAFRTMMTRRTVLTYSGNVVFL